MVYTYQINGIDYDVRHLTNGDITVTSGAWILARYRLPSQRIVIIDRDAPAEMLEMARQLLHRLRLRSL